MLSRKSRIGHDALIKKLDATKLIISELRHLLKRRSETVERLRRELADARAKAADELADARAKAADAILKAAPRQKGCGCRHCAEVARRSQKGAK